MTEIEKCRQLLQKKLDSEKSLEDRNKMGQFSTPYSLARQICEYVCVQLGTSIDSFLEPSIGTGAFFSALSEMVEIKRSVGYEIDEFYFKPAERLWADRQIELINKDFLMTEPNEKFSLILANPPYTRHHHIDNVYKKTLGEKIAKNFGLKVSGLAGLHIYFMMLSSLWLEEGGYSFWLVPTESLYVNYGRELKKFLLDNVDLIGIHSFDNNDVQFTDALVSSSIIVFRKTSSRTAQVRFSWGSDLNHPAHECIVRKDSLDSSLKWNKENILNKVSCSHPEITIGTFFTVKRGIATGDNKFFIVDNVVRDAYKLPMSVLTPIIPPPRKLKSDIYTSEDFMSDNQYLITCKNDKEEIKNHYPGLYKYLMKGEHEDVNLRSNCKNRDPWYGLERREVPPIFVSYMGRESGQKLLPIRFILNRAGVIATNSYLCLYPRDEYKQYFKDSDICKDVWWALSSISANVLKAYGRSYGGGLLKWEPKELASIPCSELSQILKPLNRSLFD